MAKKTKETPLMKQYNTIKAKYPDALLLFRVGDFYETFGDDAVKAAASIFVAIWCACKMDMSFSTLIWNVSSL